MLVFSGVFLRFPVIRCFPVFLVTGQGGHFSKHEPTHAILAHFVLRKFILQIRLCSHPVGLDVWFLVRLFVYFHCSCVRTGKALARLHRCTGSPELSLVAYAISTIILRAGANIFLGCSEIQSEILIFDITPHSFWQTPQCFDAYVSRNWSQLMRLRYL